MLPMEKILEREIEYALGCTEPGAVALAVSRAKDALGFCPERLVLEVSGNVLKNAMHVGIPGTELKGIEIAAALGCIAGRWEYGLEVLKDIKPEDVARAQEMLREGRLEVLLHDGKEKLYIRAVCSGHGQSASAVIEKYHTSFSSVCRDEKILFVRAQKGEEEKREEEGGSYGLTLRAIWAYVEKTDCTKIPVLSQVEEVNMRIAEEGLDAEYGLGVGRRLYERAKRDDAMNLETAAVAWASAAADARMAGCMLPVMATTGSGNQGITASVPVLAAAKWLGSTRQAAYQALALSELVTIHVKEYIGRLSALCGCAIAASIGSACGIVSLLGGGYENCACAVQNMVADISGLICDGAKSGCALKIATAVGGAVQCAFLAMDKVRAPGRDGIVCEDVEVTIQNLGNLGQAGMQEADRVILEMMMTNR